MPVMPVMQRRNFLRWGVAGAAATGACAPSGATLDPERAAKRSQRPPLSDHELQQRLTAIDHGMRHIQSARLGWAPAAAHGEESVDAQLFRSSMRSLLLTSSVNDLPEADRARPEVRQRILDVAPEVDYAVSGSLQRVSQISQHELTDIQAALKDDPGLPKQIAEAIDEQAHDGGVPLRRRLHFRRMVNHVLWRMKKQSVGLVIEETMAKVQRMADRYAKSDHLRAVLEPNPADIARWDAQTRRVAALYPAPPTARYQDPTATTPPPSSEVAPDPLAASSITPAADPAAVQRAQEIEFMRRMEAQRTEDRRQQREESGRSLMVAGGATMGAGVALALIGVGLVFTPLIIVGWVSWTVAGILLIVGIILMIVGAVRRSRARAEAPAGT